MSRPAMRRWEDLDGATREALDRRYLKELESWEEPGLSEEAVRAYLDFRRARPDASITTFEEGTIRRMLHPYRDPSALPDPPVAEPHVGRIERTGSTRFHWTNDQSYLGLMVLLTVLFVMVLVVLVAWL